MKGGNGCVFKFLGSAKKWKAVMQRAKRAELRSSPEWRTKRTKRAKQRDAAENLSGARVLPAKDLSRKERKGRKEMKYGNEAPLKSHANFAK